MWLLTIDRSGPGRATLTFGVPETDDAFGGFGCVRGGATTLTILAAGAGRPGATAEAVLAVGETRRAIAGRLVANEETAETAFEGRLSIADPIFAAMKRGETLIATLGRSRQIVPLDGAIDKIDEFAAFCAKRGPGGAKVKSAAPPARR